MGFERAACDACRARVTDPHRPAGSYGARGRVGTGTHFLSTECDDRIFSTLGSLIYGFAAKSVSIGKLSIERVVGNPRRYDGIKCRVSFRLTDSR